MSEENQQPSHQQTGGDERTRVKKESGSVKKANKNKRRGGRGNGKGNKNHNHNSNNSHLSGKKKSGFKGSISDMNGHVFECHGESYSATQYTRTMQELETYSMTTYKFGDNIAYLVRNLEDVDIDASKPEYPTKRIATVNDYGKDVKIICPTEKEIWKINTERHCSRKELYRQNKMALYMVVWGQCSDSMKAKVKTLDKYPVMDKSRDSLSLLVAIKSIAYRFESQGRYVHLALLNAKAGFYRFSQHKGMTNADYLHKFQDICGIIEHYGGTIGEDPVLVQDELRRKNVTDYDKRVAGDVDYDACVPDAKARFLAVAFLKGADRNRFGKLVTDLENQFARGNNQYPKDLTGAYNLLVNFKQSTRNTNHLRDITNTKKQVESESESENDSDDSAGQSSGVVFLTNAMGQKIICNNCGGNHYANSPECPHNNKSKAKSQQYLQFSSKTVEALVFITSTFNSRNYDDVVFVSFLEDIGVSPSASPTTFTNYSFLQGPNLHRDWILLDNQSNVDMFCNKEYLLDIGPAPFSITSYSNGGSQITDEDGTLPGYGKVWFNPDSLANILSFSNVEDKFPISYSKGNFRVHLSDTKKLDFQRVENNLFIYKPSASCSNKDIFIFVQTVTGNQVNFSQEEIDRADVARRLYICLGRPSHCTFKYMLNHDLIRNANVTSADAERAVVLYGPDVGALRGKRVRQAAQAVRVPDFIPLPEEIKERFGLLMLCVDYFFIDRVPFLLSFSRNIQFLMVEQTVNRQRDTMMQHFTTVLQIYHGRGFRVQCILGDGEFNCLNEFFQRSNIVFNPAAADEHVHDVERQIRIIKERIRGHLGVSPFRYVPLTMKKELVLGTINNLNYTVRRSGISPLLCPMSLVMGRELDADRLCRLPFGAYCEIDEFDEPRNNVHNDRTTAAISLRPMDNFQAGYYFLRCDTWRVVTCWSWTELPMPANLVASVEARARKERDLRAHSIDFTFLRRDRSEITSMLSDDSALLVDLDPPEDPGAEDPDATPPATPPRAPAAAPAEAPPQVPAAAPAETPAVAPAAAPANVPIPAPTTTPTAAPDNNPTAAPTTTPIAAPSITSPHRENSGAHQLENEGALDDLINNNNEDADDNDNDLSTRSERSEESLSSDLSYSYEETTTSDAIDTLEAVTQGINHGVDHTPEPARRNPKAKDEIDGADINEDNIIEQDEDPGRPGTTRYNLRPQVPRFLEKEYVNLLQSIEAKAPSELPFIDYNGRYAFAFTQMSAAEGLRRYGDKAADALISEWKQLHNLNVFEGVNFTELSRAQRASALRLVQLIKEKRCGKVKGRTCADGRPQRDFVDSADSTSPTVAVEALFLTLVIDAHERRHVATCDISGAFLKSDIDKEVFVIVDGALVEMLIKSDPTYEQFVHTTRSGQKIVYLKLLKALYGTVRAARLFYENLADKLFKFGFKLNPYDQCVANMIIEGSQCTVCWHVDDLKISHKKKSVVDKVIKYLESIFGEMNCTHGSMHTYVGMDIIFPEDGSVQIDMSSYTNETVEEFPEEVKPASTPAASNLFTINEKCAKLPEATREVFHKVVAKLLFVTTRGRPDIFLPIAFLTLRVTKADTDDWRKLKRVLGYLKATSELKLTLSADSLNVMKWWVDASFAVRDDFKSQTGSGMSFGLGMLFSKSAKQKLVTKSSTEAELVGASDAVAMMIWTKYFMEGQGYNIDKSILHQDNKSAILLEKNGKMSSSARTRHVNIQYFFIKDRISARELSVEYCPTDNMLADYHTKPLQGSKFKTFRDMILGIIPISFNEESEERLGA